MMPVRLRLLHLDDALLRQRRFLAACDALGAQHIDAREAGASIRLWSRGRDMNALRETLDSQMEDASPGVSLTWFGSGDFHHVTAALVEIAVRRWGERVTVVHFDNHPDWVRHRRTLHCGSWASHVLRSGAAARVISLGVSSGDLGCPEMKGADLQLIATGRQVVFPLQRASTLVARRYGDGLAHVCRGHRIHWTQFATEPDAQIAAQVLASIDTEAVYITVDKDVLRQEYARTNWDQGHLSIAGLNAWLQVIARHHVIVGVDIGGDYSSPVYKGSVIDVCLKRAEALIDQGWAGASRCDDEQVNEASNLQLLASISRLLC